MSFNNDIGEKKMSDESRYAEDAPQSEGQTIENQDSGDSSDAASTTEEQQEVQNVSEGSEDVSRETPKADEKIVFNTKDEFDAETTKIRKIAERKVKRELERAYNEKFAQNQAQTQQVQQAQVTTPPDSNSVWDEALQTWIPGDMTISGYGEFAAQRAQQMNPQQQVQQPAAQQVQQARQGMQPFYSDDAEDQAIECNERISDFSDVLSKSPITPEMANAAATDSEGIKNLYELQKTQPHVIYEVSRLSPIQQQKRVWELNREIANSKKAKVQSSATPQPAPLKESGISMKKPLSEMSYKEKKALREREIWGK